MLLECPKCGYREFTFNELTVTCDNCGRIVEIDLVSEEGDTLLERYEKIIGSKKVLS